MKLAIKIKDLKEILKITKPIINTAYSRLSKEAFYHIHMECKNGKLIVAAVDGWSMIVKEYSCFSEEDGSALIPVFSIPRNSSDRENSVEVDFGRSKSIFSVPNTNEYIDYKSIFPTSDIEYKIAFNPQLMSDICKNLTKYAEFEFYGKLCPCVIKTENERRVILPMRITGSGDSNV